MACHRTGTERTNYRATWLVGLSVFLAGVIPCVAFHQAVHLKHVDPWNTRYRHGFISSGSHTRRPCYFFQNRTCLSSSTSPDDTKPIPSTRRRTIFITTLATILPTKAHAAPILSILRGEERRQLDLCLVNVMRIRYWALTLGRSLQDKLEEGVDATDAYLEARLGAKASLTKRIGGGANMNVLRLSSIQIRESLRDAAGWCADSKKKKSQGLSVCGDYREVENASEEIIETLAALVEFDGLDNTLDPSPRSTLFRTMYNKDKATYVKRLLLERLAPSCRRFILCFGGGETERKIEGFTARTYPDEIPVDKRVDASSVSSSS